jgi:hypothetical protein
MTHLIPRFCLIEKKLDNGTLLLVREARLALFTTVEEVALARKAALEGEEQKKVKREEIQKI